MCWKGPYSKGIGLDLYAFNTREVKLSMLRPWIRKLCKNGPWDVNGLNIRAEEPLGMQIK